ncbi:HAD ATPase, P-type, family IC [Spizellomyces punctatus DAOM BR117]|uniref:HAD ATPase, P-type, family IC n=1 Tax=Spizellomyces punctatus (strain DAOM BR117) TaxID=645134 RepID=A0A0L0H834_SPIPD|nr:HAD ATPase, P-type, family IC [Spizellomyces punctatus DAOM BR117]KNC97081.1 HAD ATPase, P-type, family IC [Spizellomyces punctatus DAOM BR117]|eukprot:XP_016605121.1 HAD ATPase, P-type, family IC [Spizellomyces punctatus DAOM BR117]
MTVEEVQKKYNVSFTPEKPASSQGLSAAEAAKRLEEYGPNQLSPPKKRHPFLKFLDHLLGLFNLMLLVAGVASYILLAIDFEGNKPNLWLGAILLAVAFLNAFIEFFQGQKSAAILESFLNLIPAKCYVVRDGKVAQISALELVLGDIVYARSGDKLPADLYIFSANELKVDNSSLTGEADPQERGPRNRYQNPLEATNLVFNGTLVVNGEGYGVVVRTGDNTVIGQIASLTANEERGKSPLTTEIDLFVKLIASVAAVVAIIFFILGLTAKGLNISQALNFAIGTFVSFVPEGLPATVTILLTFAAKRMALRNVLEGPVSERPILGDATESGLLRNAAAKIKDFDGIYDRYPKVLEIPFNSDNKWALTVHRKPHDKGDLMLYLKGAPERVLRLCSTFLQGNETVPLTEEHKKQFEATYTLMASKGHRVLAFAALALPREQYPADFVFNKDPPNYPTTGLTFYGLVSLEDPPKHGVREAIGHCREAGIKVMMVTGDHPLTAEAIGRKINLMLQDTKEKLAQKRNVPVESIPESDVNAIVIHGEQIDHLTESDWENIFDKEEIIFARTSPKHKLQIVKRAQSRGHIVGVTGDGVNDSPALKKADLGIAMNVSGSDVSKEAAAMILIDDNFASTVSGIEEGRLIFQNLKKSVRYTVTHTMPQVWANLLYIIVPLPLPLGAMLILVTDLGFELFNALSYAWDPPESKTGLMKLAPRKPVTAASIERLRRREREAAADRPPHDPESGTPPPRTLSAKISNGWRTVKSVFTRRFWRDHFEETEEEVLVDREILCWSYLEAGTIETIGCLATYFTAMWYYKRLTPYEAQRYAGQWGTDGPITLMNGNILSVDEQKEVNNVGQSGYYMAIFFQQCFNLFICKARLGLPIGSFMFSNRYNFVGILFGMALVCFVVYVPPLNVAFSTSWHLSPIMWLIPIGNGCLLFGYAIVRTIIIRMRNPIKYTRDVVGLQMYPTRWSTRG